MESPNCIPDRAGTIVHPRSLMVISMVGRVGIVCTYIRRDQVLECRSSHRLPGPRLKITPGSVGTALTPQSNRHGFLEPAPWEDIDWGRCNLERPLCLPSLPRASWSLSLGDQAVVYPLQSFPACLSFQSSPFCCSGRRVIWASSFGRADGYRGIFLCLVLWVGGRYSDLPGQSQLGVEGPMRYYFRQAA